MYHSVFFSPIDKQRTGVPEVRNFYSTSGVCQVNTGVYEPLIYLKLLPEFNIETHILILYLFEVFIFRPTPSPKYVPVQDGNLSVMRGGYNSHTMGRYVAVVFQFVRLDLCPAKARAGRVDTFRKSFR